MSFHHHFNRTAREKAKLRHSALVATVQVLAVAGVGKHTLASVIYATDNAQYAMFRELKDRMPPDVITVLIRSSTTRSYTHAYVIPKDSIDLIDLEKKAGRGATISPSRTAVHLMATHEHLVAHSVDDIHG